MITSGVLSATRIRGNPCAHKKEEGKGREGRRKEGGRGGREGSGGAISTQRAHPSTHDLSREAHPSQRLPLSLSHRIARLEAPPLSSSLSRKHLRGLFR